MGDGVGDTPQTVMTTRAPAVLIKQQYYETISPCTKEEEYESWANVLFSHRYLCPNLFCCDFQVFSQYFDYKFLQYYIFMTNICCTMY